MIIRPVISSVVRPSLTGYSPNKGGGVSPFAFTFNGQPFTFAGVQFTYGAPA